METEEGLRQRQNGDRDGIETKYLQRLKDSAVALQMHCVSA